MTLLVKVMLVTPKHKKKSRKIMLIKRKKKQIIIATHIKRKKRNRVFKIQMTLSAQNYAYCKKKIIAINKKQKKYRDI